MIKHMVAFYFADSMNEKDREEAKTVIIDAIDRIRNAKIPGVLRLDAVFNTVEGMPEYGMYGEYEDEKALEAYQIHPEHLRLKELSKDFCKSRIVIDWK